MKNGWFIISYAPFIPGEEPRRFKGFLFSNPIIRDLASAVIFFGSFSFSYKILLNSYSLFYEKYGVVPTSISYKRTPKRYQSND